MPTKKAKSVTPASRKPCQVINQTNCRLTRGRRGSRGGRFMMSGAEASNASAKAGKTFVIMFSHRMARAASGSGQPSKIATKMTWICEKLQQKAK